MERKIIVIAGPTAVGKTKLSVDIAKLLGTEIISGDSMQIYRGMDIGTAKVTEEETKGVKHHLIDIRDPDEEYSVAEFKEDAMRIIDDLHKRDLIPVIAGGTGLFIDSIIKVRSYKDQIKDDRLRHELEQFAITYGNEALHEKLKAEDPESYERLHPNNLKRVIRALEVRYLTGIPFSEFKDPEGLNPDFDVLYYYLNMERQKLYDRINMRVDIMINNGLIDEVRGLIENGVDPHAQSMMAIGYKEIVSYLNGETDLDKAIDRIKQGSRNYAKRQLTWFRNDGYARELNKDRLSDEEIIKYIADEAMKQG